MNIKRSPMGVMKRMTGLGLAAAGAALGSAVLVTDAQAMPQWARKYGVSCTVCHTTVPRLTRVGYQFRRAGFRMPDEIGQEAKGEGLKNLYSVRIREEFRVNGTATNSAGEPVPATNKFVFHELTFYPITGAIGKYWAAESELTFNPGEEVEVENAYVRATYPLQEDAWLTARAGLFHPFEGYGASDRPISNVRPLFQTSSAKNGAFDTLVHLWGQDQEGVEVGGTYKDTTMTVAVLNGFNTGKGTATEGDDNNLRDYLLFFNQLVGDGAGLSAEYLNGKTSFAIGGGAGSGWINNYHRVALYGNYPVLGEKLNLLAGGAVGKDHFPNPTDASDNSDKFNNAGWFVQTESRLHDHFTGAVRYDVFDPSTRAGNDRLSAVTFTAVVPFDWVKFLLDYRIKRTQRPTADARVDNAVRAEWMIHF